MWVTGKLQSSIVARSRHGELKDGQDVHRTKGGNTQRMKGDYGYSRRLAWMQTDMVWSCILGEHGTVDGFGCQVHSLRGERESVGSAAGGVGRLGGPMT